MPPLDPAVIALIATVFGGVGLKVVEHWLGKPRSKVDDATRIRDELRIEITSLKEEIKELEDERDRYRNEYYDLRDKYSNIYSELQLIKTHLQGMNENVEAAEHIDKTQPPPVAT